LSRWCQERDPGVHGGHRASDPGRDLNWCHDERRDRGNLSKDPQRVKDLASKSGLSERTTERRLHDLERWGVVRRSRSRSAGRGRPATLWALASSAWTRFEQIADAFTLEQLEAEAERMRVVIDKRSRDSVRSMKDAAKAG
jgi:predicted ArsR family transcriptional regulator